MRSEFDELKQMAADYYLRELTDAERLTLQEGLKAHAELRDVFMNSGCDEWLLHHLYRSGVSQPIQIRPRRTATQRALQWAASVLIVLTLGTLLLAKHAGDASGVATVTDCFVLENDAISAVNHGEVRVINQASLLRNGDRVVVPQGSRLTFQYQHETTTVHLRGESLFTLTDHDGAKHIQLAQGQLTADVDQQAVGKPMRITTANAEAVVLGTSFELSAGDVTRLAVLKGCVRFNSSDANQSIEVASGRLAESDEGAGWESLPFRNQALPPDEDWTLGSSRNRAYISVDYQRSYFGYLKFDLGSLDGELIEATLRLRVMKKGSDRGGSGRIRLYALPEGLAPDCATIDLGEQVACYQGKVGAGMDLEFDINPAKLSGGETAFLISQDPGGNDFWFSSSEGRVCPQLLLKVQTAD